MDWFEAIFFKAKKKSSFFAFEGDSASGTRTEVPKLQISIQVFMIIFSVT